MIIPTWRLLPVALAGALVAGLSGSHTLALIVALLWLAGTALLGVIDGHLVPRSRLLLWEREHEAKLSLGAWNRVSVSLRNTSRRPLTFQMRDSLPPRIVPSGETTRGRCAPGATWSLDYQVIPTHRGDFSFGPVTARYLGPLGLTWRQYSVRLDDHFKVYPNLLAIHRYETLIRRGQLQEMGLQVARTWDIGTEFDRLREYSHDDEFRRINWPATARMHRPIAVDYQTERSQPIMVVLDAGRLMAVQVPPEPEEGDTAPVTLTRLDYAVNAALLLAFVSQQRGDRVGLLAFSDHIMRYVTPRAGRGQFLTLTEALYDLHAEPTETNYATGLEYLANRNARRSLVIIFTDLSDAGSVPTLAAQVIHLARRHLPLVVTLRDPEIQDLARQAPSTSEAVYERAVAQSLLDDRTEILRRLEQHGVLTLDVTAGQLSPSVVNRYLEIKARGRL